MDLKKYARADQGDETGSDAKDWLLALGMVAAVLLAYHPVWFAGFIWDDDRYVTQNPLLTGPGAMRRIWFSLDSPSQYFPLTYTTFYFERALWGLHAAGYHRINLFLHAVNSILVWRVLSRLQVPGAWLAAGVFALHPVQVESVAWITERKNVLMGFFYLMSALEWTRFTDDNNKARGRSYGLALFYYALALLAKTTACTLPAALLLILWFKRIPIDRRRLAQAAPFVVLGLGMGLVTMWWERNKIGTHGPMFEIGPLERLLIASRALWFYVGKLAWPTNLAFSYPRWTIRASDPAAYYWLVATGIAGAAIWQTRRWFGRSVATAALFFAATLGPMLGFIMLATFLYSFVADHYQYLACIGPIALAAAGIQRGLAAVAPRGASLHAVVCAGLLASLGALTWKQSEMYSNEETLWRATLARNPGSWMAENNLGLVLARRGEGGEAIAHFRKSVELNPRHAKALDNLANALALSGDVVGAIGQFRKALEVDPRDADAHYNLGNILAIEGDAAGAIAQFRQSLDIYPDRPYVLNSLAWWLATASDGLLRNGTQAVLLATKANQLAGGANPIILQTLAAAYAEAGRYGEACSAARLAEHRATENQDGALAQRLRQEIQLYEAGRPLREAR